MSVAVAILCIAVAVVWLGRDGYSDSDGTPLTLLDCFYYVTVSLSTTGYGDIVPLTTSARSVNAFVVTPLRVLFLIVLIGTTLEALTESSRRAWRIQRWRRQLRDHFVIIGFGTKGQTATHALLDAGIAPSDIVVVDTSTDALDAAEHLELVSVRGDGTHAEVHALAVVARARSVLVAVSDEAAAALIILTGREQSSAVQISAVARTAESANLLYRSGADSVIVSDETAGRLLGMATRSPHVIGVLEDLLDQTTSGLALSPRMITDDESGRLLTDLPEPVLGVIRYNEFVRRDQILARPLQLGDVVVVVGSPSERR